MVRKKELKIYEQCQYYFKFIFIYEVLEFIGCVVEIFFVIDYIVFYIKEINNNSLDD